MDIPRPPLPPFDEYSAKSKVRMAEITKMLKKSR
jgi:nuclear transport factor 2 (NTF2) superfamily protein